MSRHLHRLTPHPPLGWNSYDSFGCFINERRAMENLRVFVDRLKPHGYEYFVIDAGWFRNYDLRGREFPQKHDSYEVLHDAFGRPVPAPGFFPRGVQPLAQACHDAGVKFGIHMMRGIPRAAVKVNTPIVGSRWRAADIANAADICPWCPDNYGVDMSRDGSQAYYDSVIAMLADWGVDFIKYDDIVPSPREVEAVVRAIEKCPRDIVLSLSPGNAHHPDGWPAYFRANMIRTTGDVWDDRSSLNIVFDRWEKYQQIAAEMPLGCWLDMDMIPFGELQVWNPAESGDAGDIMMNGKGEHRICQFTPAQKRSFMIMRALAASPLMMGGNLPGTGEATFVLITHPEVLACNRNGVVGKLISRDQYSSTWLTRQRDQHDRGWFGVFNRDGDRAHEFIMDASALGISTSSQVYDIWNQRDLGMLTSPLRVTLEPDDALFARFVGG